MRGHGPRRRGTRAALVWLALRNNRPTACAMLRSFVPELTEALDALTEELALDDAEIWKRLAEAGQREGET